MHSLLVVDDEKNMLNVLKILFESDGYRVLTAANGLAALEVFEANPDIDLIVSDLKMPEMDGLALMREIRQRDPSLVFVMISAYGTIDKAVEAMKHGAADFITKPFNKELILHTVRKVLNLRRLRQENSALRSNQKQVNLVFRSRPMHELVDTIRKIARYPSPILVTGESGSGKEVVAQTIHSLYQAEAVRPFISINCPAVPESLLESELFGYRKGAFTGADKDFPGKVKLAEGGTLFLDEIGDLPLAIQPKLLRLLENKTIEPLGTANPVRINTRIICATNKDLPALVARGQFRQDLFYRINTFHLHIPPLRERQADIAPLLEYFLDKYSSELNLGERSFSAEVLRVLESYVWPGNVRELKNFVERTVILSAQAEIGVDDLPDALRRSELRPVLQAERPEFFSSPALEPHGSTLSAIEKRLLEDTLGQFSGNISAAARHLGISRNTMRYRLKKYGLSSLEA